MNRNNHWANWRTITALWLICILGAGAVQAEPTLEERVVELETKIKMLELQIIGMNALIQSVIGNGQTPITGPDDEAEPPAENMIRGAIAEMFDSSVPVSWAGHMGGGRKGRIDEFEIVQMGNFNERGEYWPVRAHIAGICQVETFTGKKNKRFDKTGDFKILRDDYGKWIARTDEW